MNELRGKTAVVSGGAQGIGAALGEQLSQAGAQIFLVDTSSSVSNTAAEIQSATGNPTHSLKADVANIEDVRRVAAEVAATFNKVDFLIHGAGVWQRTPVDASWEDAVAVWDKIINPNLKGVLLLSRALIPLLNQNGCILNLSSADVLPINQFATNPPDQDVYLASKWALNGFTDAWAEQLKRRKIRVNSLCLGPVATSMLEEQKR